MRKIGIRIGIGALELIGGSLIYLTLQPVRYILPNSHSERKQIEDLTERAIGVIYLGIGRILNKSDYINEGFKRTRIPDN
ncbi:MAG: hypothetical protein AABX30_01970 [Nanoarchaeota archaeon]